MSLRAACALALLSALALGAAPSAHAYRLGGQSWHGRPAVISYWNGTGYGKEIRKAAAAWNRSGARVRFVRSSRARARVKIVYDRGVPGPFGFAHGYASIGLQSVNRVTLGRGASGDVITLVIAHELGHIMGLNHETRRCATMNPSVAERCGKTPPCTILQPDDVRGAIARYGGRARTRPRELCPPTPRDVRVQPLSSGYGMEVVVKDVPAADRVAARIARDQCPSKPGGDGASLARAAGSVGRARISASATRRFPVGPDGDPAKWAGQKYCLSVWLQDSFGRLSPKPATRRFVATASPLPAPREPIVAASDFSAQLSWQPATHSAAVGQEIAWARGGDVPGGAVSGPVRQPDVRHRDDRRHPDSVPGRRPLVHRDLDAGPVRAPQRTCAGARGHSRQRRPAGWVHRLAAARDCGQLGHVHGYVDRPRERDLLVVLELRRPVLRLCEQFDRAEPDPHLRDRGRLRGDAQDHGRRRPHERGVVHRRGRARRTVRACGRVDAHTSA